MSLNPEAEKMIGVFSDFLNAHSLANHEEDNLVIRANYDEENDPPRVLLDHADFIDEYRIIHLYAHPYHDEGGPNRLTGFFSGWRNQAGEIEWDLDELIQYFDATYSVILDNGQRTDAWPSNSIHKP